MSEYKKNFGPLYFSSTISGSGWTFARSFPDGSTMWDGTGTWSTRSISLADLETTIPIGADIESVSLSLNSGYVSATLQVDGVSYGSLTAAKIKQALDEGKRNLSMYFSYRYTLNGVKSPDANKPASKTENKTIGTFTLTIVYAGNDTRTVVRYGIGGEWVDCDTYVGQDGKWIPTQVYFGDNGGWKKIEQRTIQTE